MVGVSYPKAFILDFIKVNFESFSVKEQCFLFIVGFIRVLSQFGEMDNLGDVFREKILQNVCIDY